MSVLTGGMTRPDSAYSPAGHPQDSCRPLESFSLLTLGTCIQGFVLAAIATLVGGTAAAGILIGRLLGVTAPGLLLAMGVGRLGCDAWIWQGIYSQRADPTIPSEGDPITHCSCRPGGGRGTSRGPGDGETPGIQGIVSELEGSSVQVERLGRRTMLMVRRRSTVRFRKGAPQVSGVFRACIR
jgi:hypothetical protein